MDVGAEGVEVCRDGKRVGCREEGCREVVEESVGVQAGVEEEGRCLSKTGRQRSGHWPDENAGMGCVMWSRRECKTGRGGMLSKFRVWENQGKGGVYGSMHGGNRRRGGCRKKMGCRDRWSG